MKKSVGSTFTLILPFTIDEHQPSASAETATDTPADLTDLHILVVEDNELNLEIAVFSLEAAGLNVSTAINGLEAVRLFWKNSKAIRIRHHSYGYYDAGYEWSGCRKGDPRTFPP